MCLSISFSHFVSLILSNLLTWWSSQHRCSCFRIDDLRLQQLFPKHHSTIDHLVTLRVLMEENPLRGKGLYCCFVDFKTTFDMVPHEHVWEFYFVDIDIQMGNICFKRTIEKKSWNDANLHSNTKPLHNCLERGGGEDLWKSSVYNTFVLWERTNFS